MTEIHRVSVAILGAGLWVAACSEPAPPSVGTHASGLVPGRPVGVAPVGPVGPTPDFIWTVADGEATEFQLWINDSTGTDITMGALYSAASAGCDTGAFPRTCTLPSPISLAGGSGRWWVRGQHPVDGFGAWSAGLSFDVQCPVAALVGPTGTTNDTTPTYEWVALDNISEYRLYVRDSVSNPVVDQVVTPAAAGCAGGSGGPNCTFTPATAVAEGQVTFWVQTCSQTWSSSLTFNVSTNCSVGGGCDDGNPCTDDICMGMSCTHTPNTAACSDGNPCTTGDICNGMGSCEATDQAACRPVVTAPTGANIGYNPTYTWNEVAATPTYRLWLNDCDGTRKIDEIYQAADVCSLGVCATSTFPSSSSPLPTLSNGTVRFWVQGPPHVDGAGPLHHGPWSVVAEGTNGLDRVTTLSPTGPAGTNQPTFAWTPLSGQNHTYELYIRDANSVNYIIDLTEAAAGCPGGTGVCSHFPGLTLPTGTSRFWVRANEHCGALLWSLERVFEVP